MDLETYLGGMAIMMGGNVVGLNLLAYIETKVSARNREQWKEEEFQTKCGEYWRETPLRKDLEGTKKRVGELIMSICYTPGAFLACKSLYREGYRKPTPLGPRMSKIYRGAESFLEQAEDKNNKNKS